MCLLAVACSCCKLRASAKMSWEGIFRIYVCAWQHNGMLCCYAYALMPAVVVRKIVSYLDIFIFMFIYLYLSLSLSFAHCCIFMIIDLCNTLNWYKNILRVSNISLASCVPHAVKQFKREIEIFPTYIS